MGKIKIIGGKHRSRVLTVIDAVGLRPSSNRVRETLFNWLGQDLTGKNCLDMFAGSGALGFEALSRNACSVTMLEQDLLVYRQLRINQDLLKLDNLNLVHANALNYITNSKQQFAVIFLDPPYASDLLSASLQLIKRNLAPNGVVFVEYQNLPDLTGYTVYKQARYARVNFALLKLNNQ